MKKIKFLIKINEEGKLSFVDPSENIASSYVKKSDSYLDSAKILLKAEKLEESVSMSYYSMYHCLLALLFRCGIKSENHSASILLLKELFKQEELSDIISFGKKERVDKEYYVEFELTRFDCEDMVKKAEDFTVGCKIFIRKLDEKKVNELRLDLEGSLKR